MELNIATQADRLAQVNSQIAALQKEADELEGYFLKLADTDLRNTKLKTVRYTGTGANRVTATMASKVKVLYPSLLKDIFGKAYADAVTEEVKPQYKLSAPAQRLLEGLYLQNYTQTTVEDVIRQATQDPAAQKALAKKVKGASFNNDKKYLMAIAGLPEEDAEEYAFFAAEAAVWQDFQRLQEATQLDETGKKKVLELINTAVVVEETPKITVEAS